MKLSNPEKAIWNAAYAAAFIHDFDDHLYRNGGDWNKAAETITAENAVTLADLAVLKLAEWEPSNSSIGGRIDKEHYQEIGWIEVNK